MKYFIVIVTTIVELLCKIIICMIYICVVYLELNTKTVQIKLLWKSI